MSSTNLYLLDTNVISHLMRDPTGPAAKRAFAIEARDESSAMFTSVMCTSVIVQCELLFGMARLTSPKWVIQYQRVMSGLEVLPLEPNVATHYAQLRAALERNGTPIGANDSLIAAHALALGATLVTADAEFARVPGLRVENWYD